MVWLFSLYIIFDLASGQQWSVEQVCHLLHVLLLPPNGDNHAWPLAWHCWKSNKEYFLYRECHIDKSAEVSSWEHEMICGALSSATWENRMKEGKMKGRGGGEKGREKKEEGDWEFIMQVADIISWVVGQICMLSQKGSSSACVRVCMWCMCVCGVEIEQERKRVSNGHNNKKKSWLTVCGFRQIKSLMWDDTIGWLTKQSYTHTGVHKHVHTHTHVFS